MIKIINGVEKVPVFPFVAFDYEYSFSKYRLTRFKSEVVLREKIGFVVFHRMHDTKHGGQLKKNLREAIL